MSDAQRDGLVARVTEATPEDAFSAAADIAEIGQKRKLDALLPWLGAEDDRYFAAATYALQMLGSPRAVSPLYRIVKEDASFDRRLDAMYTLAFLFGDKWRPSAQRALHKALIETAEDATVYPPIRAQAFEGLANCFGSADRRTLRFKRVVRAIRTGLRDRSPEVRFWACFAAMQLRATQSRDLLEDLAQNDATVIPHLWSIKNEASDALARLDHARAPTADHWMIPIGTWHDSDVYDRWPQDLDRLYKALIESLGRWLPYAPISRTEVPDTPGAIGATVSVGTQLEGSTKLLKKMGFEPEEGQETALRGWFGSRSGRCMVRVVLDTDTHPAV